MTDWIEEEAQRIVRGDVLYGGAHGGGKEAVRRRVVELRTANTGALIQKQTDPEILELQQRHQPRARMLPQLPWPTTVYRFYCTDDDSPEAREFRERRDLRRWMAATLEMAEARICTCGDRRHQYDQFGMTRFDPKCPVHGYEPPDPHEYTDDGGEW